MTRRLLLTLGIVTFATCVHAGDSASFNRDIKPLLDKHCSACHAGEGRRRTFASITRPPTLRRVEFAASGKRRTTC